MSADSAERELVDRLVSGDASAWSSFVEQFQRLVLTRVVATARELNQTLSESDAEDLCAEVFSQLVARDFASLRRFAGRSRISTWLTVVTRRICLRQLSRGYREPGVLGDDHGERTAAVEAPEDEPLAALIRCENRRLLQRGIAQLNPRQQALLQLCYLDGCSYREISEKLEIPVNSIGPTLQRVYRRLRELMNVEQP